MTAAYLGPEAGDVGSVRVGSTCTCTGAPSAPSLATGAIVRYRRGTSPAPSTTWRIGPTALTTAAPAGFVLNWAMGSSAPEPSGCAESASA